MRASITLTLVFIGSTVSCTQAPDPATLSVVAAPSAQSHAEWCNPRTLSPEQISTNRSHAKEAAQYAAYAILSNDAYGTSHEQIPLPPDWTRVKFDFVGGETGLALAVFEKRTNGGLTEVVMSFRGTDDRLDWKTNLEPLHRVQMKPAETNFEALSARYEGSHVRIVTTGHSLGGGLAMHISFHYPGVDAVVFDASPVARPGLMPKTQAHRVSISESGEVLEVLRDAASVRWPNTERIKYRFVHDLPVEQHSMPMLAANLVKLGTTESPALAEFVKRECRSIGS